jgi:hypothetical protein
MSANYNEGPYANWTAIKFDSWRLKVLFALSQTILFDARDSEGNQVPDVDATAFQKIVTGETSGAQADLRNIPVGAYFTTNLPETPDCVLSYTNMYLIPSGAAQTSVPFYGANIREYNGVDAAFITVMVQDSWAYEEGPPETCVSNNDRPALPGFITGEYCTLTDS